MPVVITKYEYVFDDVQFGIDIRQSREKAGITQRDLDALLDHKSGGTVSAIEAGRWAQGGKLSDFFMLCKIFDLNPYDYIDMQLGEGIDYFRLYGQ